MTDDLSDSKPCLEETEAQEAGGIRLGDRLVKLSWVSCPILRSAFRRKAGHEEQKIPPFKFSDCLVHVRMFDRFNRHRFYTLKLSKLIAVMVLHGWLKFWNRLPEWFSNFEELKIAVSHGVIWTLT